MLVHAGAWPPVKSSCRQLGAALNGLPGDLCSDSWALTAPCNRLLHSPGSPLLGQTSEDAPSSAGRGLAPLSPPTRCLRWCWRVVVLIVLVGLTKPWG